MIFSVKFRRSIIRIDQTIIKTVVLLHVFPGLLLGFLISNNLE